MKMGAYMNRADVVRSATREKLESVRILEIRKVRRPLARKEILDYLREHGTSYASDIAENLNLDLDLVFSIFQELRGEDVVE